VSLPRGASRDRLKRVYLLDSCNIPRGSFAMVPASDHRVSAQICALYVHADAAFVLAFIGGSSVGTPGCDEPRPALIGGVLPGEPQYVRSRSDRRAFASPRFCCRPMALHEVGNEPRFFGLPTASPRGGRCAFWLSLGANGCGAPSLVKPLYFLAPFRGPARLLGEIVGLRSGGSRTADRRRRHAGGAGSPGPVGRPRSRGSAFPHARLLPVWSFLRWVCVSPEALALHGPESPGFLILLRRFLFSC